jgi:hypothetical protein
MRILSRILAFASIVLLCSCSGMFQTKRGCPTNDRSMGAERVLAGEGKKKPSKFKVKGMN